MLNSVTVMGRLGADPELKYTQSGVEVTSFRIACDRDFKDGNGGRVTDWVDIVAWRSTAKMICQWFKKGRLIVVDGRLQVRDWTASDGEKRRNVEVVAEHVYFAGDRPQSESNQSGRDIQLAPEQEYTDLDGEDSELPF